MPKPYPQEFRDDVVAVARKGQAPLNQIAKDFGISEGCLHGWMKKADVEDGNRPGVSEKQPGEVREELRLAIVVWIETKYNRRRRQRALGKFTPTSLRRLTRPQKRPKNHPP